MRKNECEQSKQSTLPSPSISSSWSSAFRGDALCQLCFGRKPPGSSVGPKEGYSALLDAHYCYVMPSRNRYQFQWFWDTCFHVFILCSLGEVEIAKRNMFSLFRMQEDDGFVGHMIFWKQVLPHRLSDVLQARPKFQTLRPHMSALVQPPLVAQAVKRIYETSHPGADASRTEWRDDPPP